MRVLTQIFIIVISVACGVVLYNALGFSLIEAGISSALVGVGCVLTLYMTKRSQEDARMRTAVEDLSRLLSQNAQAGQMLSLDVQEIKSMDVAPRIKNLEADVAVLGTIVRQISEMVTALELGHSVDGASDGAKAVAQANLAELNANPVDWPSEETLARAQTPAPAAPTVPIAALQGAVAANRIEPFMQPVVTLPQRDVTAYNLIARLRLEDGDLASPGDFLSHPGGEKVVPQIDNLLILRAVQIVRRLSARKKAATLHVPLSPLTLSDEPALTKIIEFLTANIALRQDIFFELSQADFDTLSRSQINALQDLTRLGFSVVLDNVTNLRLDFVEMSGLRVRKVKVTAEQFLEHTKSLTDIHIADIVDLLSRHEIELVITGVDSEEQVLMLLDERVHFASGDHFSPVRPVRSDVLTPEEDDEFEMRSPHVVPQFGE